jgi:hypothetical protein
MLIEAADKLELFHNFDQQQTENFKVDGFMGLCRVSSDCNLFGKSEY